ncbi:MAG: NAD(P)H-dependent oxidoreductase [Zoogloea sp.]|nr:NAD(P)H-dependent oxidoreductase [Zoogloea sp.]
MKIIGLSGSLSAPSRTRGLVEAVIGEITRQTGFGGGVIDIAELAHAQLRGADLIVIGVPVYKASYPGAFKHFVDLIDPKALEGKAAILVATGGSEQHALILEHQLRALASYLGLYSAPKTVFARDTDFADYRLANPAIAERVAFVAGQAAWLLRAPAARTLAAAA